jgi:hypothetical protein
VPQYAALEQLTAERLNLLGNPPRALLRQTANQPIPNDTITPITFNAELFDSHGGHDNVTNNARYVFPLTGTYLVGGGTSFAGNATGVRSAVLRLNGGALVDNTQVTLPNPSAAATNMLLLRSGIMLPVTAGDYVELVAYQNRGGDLDTVATYGPEAPSLSVLMVYAT